jgi:hypothetical protein
MKSRDYVVAPMWLEIPAMSKRMDTKVRACHDGKIPHEIVNSQKVEVNTSMQG